MPGRAEMELEWGIELLAWWRYYNGLYLREALREPVIAVVVSSGRLGSWDAATRTLSVSESHIASDPWLAVMETLRHEMAHQFAMEVLEAHGEQPHGPAFREACRKLRVSPRACGVSSSVTPPPRAGIVDRIAKLLSLSSSPNENEAQVAVKKARELLLKHNIASVELEADREFGVRWLGRVKGRHHHFEQVLATILNDFFFVSVIWTHTFDASRRVRGTVLGAFGTEANLELAEYVHDYLSSVMQTLWTRYKESRGLQGNRERMRYFAGVLNGFHEKLKAQEKTLRQSHALVWKGDPQLESYVRYHHPSIRTGYASGTERTRAYEDGVEQGRTVTLRRPLRSEGSGCGGFLTG